MTQWHKHMEHNNYLFKPLVLIISLSFLLYGCSTLKESLINTPVRVSDELEITVKDVYGGIDKGTVQDIQLPDDSSYVTVEICIKNLLPIEQSVQRENVSIITYDNAQLSPIAQGYNQAEMFGWMLPLVEPIGGKRVVDEFIFFPIQKPELMRIPPYQSQGCSDSYQIKNYAFLFIVKKDAINKPITFYFFEKDIRFGVRKIFHISTQVKWGISLGIFIIFIGCMWIVVKRNKQKSAITDSTGAKSG